LSSSCECGIVDDIVKENARHGDVVFGLGVVCPISVDIDVRGHGCIISLRVGRVDVAQGEDVGVAVESRDAGNEVGIRVLRRSRSAVDIDDDLPLYVRVCCDGGGDIAPSGCVGARIDVQWKEDKQGDCWECKHERGKHGKKLHYRGSLEEMLAEDGSRIIWISRGRWLSSFITHVLAAGRALDSGVSAKPCLGFNSGQSPSHSHLLTNHYTIGESFA